MRINSDAPGVLAEEAFRSGALLVHYSTDYVFDGEKSSPYIEIDKPNPINAYGRTKLGGEQALQSSGCDYLIFRTSWVYASRGSNFLLTILKLAKERDQLSVVADQVGSPTSARLIADATSLSVHSAIREKQSGIFSSGLYHLTSSGYSSWHGFSEEIVKTADIFQDTDLNLKNIKAISAVDYPTPAKRPMNSCLSTTRIEKKYNICLPDWRDVLRLCVEEVYDHS